MGTSARDPQTTSPDPGRAHAPPGQPHGARLAILCYLLLGALLLAALAYWAPWIDHRTAALKLSGQDLGEFVKFIPAISSGQIAFPRQLFYLPPLACTIGLVLLSANRHLAYPRWLRVGMLGLALLLLPGLLPPVWGRPADLFTAEFRLQGMALVLGALLILSHGLFRRVPAPVLGIALGGVALIALVSPQWAFWAIRPHIWAIYNTPTVHLGWGLWLDALAWTAATVAAALLWQTGRKT